VRIIKFKIIIMETDTFTFLGYYVYKFPANMPNNPDLFMTTSRNFKIYRRNNDNSLWEELYFSDNKNREFRYLSPEEFNPNNFLKYEIRVD